LSTPLLEVNDLHVGFAAGRGRTTEVVSGVSFSVARGEVLGIVGESGSGKSLTALSINRLLPGAGRVLSGSIRFDGIELTELDAREMEQIRGSRIAMVFQDPMSSLNPVYRVGWQVGEPLRLHDTNSRKDALGHAIKMLERVGIPDAESRADQYPHEFSGGMRQRALIAAGLITNPPLLIADEPTTALDVTVQAQILDVLKDATAEFGTATILITHNLGVVAGMCDRIAVMYGGRIVETGLTEDVLVNPQHPYTWSLLRSIPRLGDKAKTPLRAIGGQPPDPARRPSGCAFHPRCSFKEDRCMTDDPKLAPLGAEGQSAACWVSQERGGLDAS
jgi:oligopeptide/dipeptide ABC transporter ATP-binding protein